MSHINYFRVIAENKELHEKYYTFFREFDFERAIVRSCQYMAECAVDCGHLTEENPELAAQSGWTFHVEEVSLEEYFEATHNKGME